MAKKAKFEGFIDARLTKDDKKHIKANLPDGDKLSSLFEQWLGRGYKVSLSVDRSSDCFVASLYGQFTTSDNPGYCLTCRHTDMVVAIAGLHHLDSVVFEDGWPTNSDYDW